MSDWELILIEWIAEAEALGEFDRANGMRETFNVLQLIEQFKQKVN